MSAEFVAEADTFIPNAENARAFRDALGRFGTGVTVITTQTPTGRVGITANSFSSVSLDPPLVLWSPAKSSKRHDIFVGAERSIIHVLGEGQKHVGNAFVKVADPFDDLDWSETADGLPLIQGCLATFECVRYAVYDGGDHSILVETVERASLKDGNPLMFYGGAYGAFIPN